MTATPDCLGRAWAHTKLDALLADPGVARSVREARAVNPRELAQWGFDRGWTRPGLALLQLLCWRAGVLERGKR